MSQNQTNETQTDTVVSLPRGHSFAGLKVVASDAVLALGGSQNVLTIGARRNFRCIPHNASALEIVGGRRRRAQLQTRSSAPIVAKAAPAKYANLNALQTEYVGETGSGGVKFIARGESGEVKGRFNTRYLRGEAREEWRLQILKGAFWRGDKPFQSRGMKSHWSQQETGVAMFVMAPDGAFYAAGQAKGRFHHSSFLCGGPVACAGEMSVDDSGKLVYINNFTGHYLSGPDNLKQVLQELRAAKVPLRNVRVGVKFVGMKNPAGQEFPDAQWFLEAAENGTLETWLEFDAAPEKPSQVLGKAKKSANKPPK